MRMKTDRFSAGDLSWLFSVRQRQPIGICRDRRTFCRVYLVFIIYNIVYYDLQMVYGNFYLHFNMIYFTYSQASCDDERKNDLDRKNSFSFHFLCSHNKVGIAVVLSDNKVRLEKVYYNVFVPHG